MYAANISDKDAIIVRLYFELKANALLLYDMWFFSTVIQEFSRKTLNHFTVFHMPINKINVKKLQFNHVLTATCIDWVHF